tara:strand:+ start:1404 stop:2390 length:987 start_codon:yes stop_codon:yes gene_type:complete
MNANKSNKISKYLDEPFNKSLYSDYKKYIRFESKISALIFFDTLYDDLFYFLENYKDKPAKVEERLESKIKLGAMTIYESIYFEIFCFIIRALTVEFTYVEESNSNIYFKSDNNIYNFKFLFPFNNTKEKSSYILKDKMQYFEILKYPILDFENNISLRKFINRVSSSIFKSEKTSAISQIFALTERETQPTKYPKEKTKCKSFKLKFGSNTSTIENLYFLLKKNYLSPDITKEEFINAFTQDWYKSSLINFECENITEFRFLLDFILDELKSMFYNLSLSSMTKSNIFRLNEKILNYRVLINARSNSKNVSHTIHIYESKIQTKLNG